MEEYRLRLYEKATPPSIDWTQRLSLCRDCGFDGIELSIDESDFRLERLTDLGKKREIWQAVEKTGVPIETMCLSAHRKYPLGSHDEQVRRRSLEILKEALELAGATGVILIQLAGYDVYYEPHDNQTVRFFRENLYRAVELAEEAGIELAFETMETPFMDTVRKAVAYVKLINSPCLRLYPDIGNLQNAAVNYGGSAVEDLRLGAGYITAAHLKETLPGIYRNLRVNSGGHTDYRSCLKELWGQGVRQYTGELWYQGEEDCAAELSRASAFLREQIAFAANSRG